MKFRKKPVVIEAVQFTGDGSYDTVTDFLGGFFAPTHYRKACTDNGGFINTLEGEMEFRPGDWIIRGVKGEYYPCKPDIFEATYEAVAP